MTTLIAGISGAIGSALAERYLHDQPAQPLIGLCRRPEMVPAAVREQENVTLIPWQADAPLSESLTDQLAEALGPSGKLHNLIYAAGLLHDDRMFPEKRLEDLNPDAMARAFQVNCIGFGMLVQALAPRFRGQHLTRVAAISAKVGSISDNRFGGWYAYRCSKSALNMMVRNLSIELTRRFSPVTCVALHPGTTESPLSEPFSQSLAKLTVHEPEDTASNLYRILDGLSENDNGRFISWDGTDLPW
ncbi:SDR family oxidoreductase [Marinobacter zhanjiangensis]|uniref:SDR family oxidoreductase n=1 Tax=Marinobacter zhanjiangensis TaxID=578215 RepID=A0ABQ3B2C5_9GAMM|nr:SDR family oxidoreductase [Marinobacter zhanjiangensis]GGY74788.1 SDR family oxidoreductase [Marinobacter zhanjiangensis]